jgi:hypothetical protein
VSQTTLFRTESWEFVRDHDDVHIPVVDHVVDAPHVDYVSVGAQGWFCSGRSRENPGSIGPYSVESRAIATLPSVDSEAPSRPIWTPFTR